MPTFIDSDRDMYRELSYAVEILSLRLAKTTGDDSNEQVARIRKEAMDKAHELAKWRAR